VDVGATLLESGPTRTAGGFGSFASSFHHVRFSLIPAIVHLLTDRFLACSKHPPWKQLITHALATDERISLIAKMFSDRDEVGTVVQLSKDDAQPFIDVIAGVCPHNFTLKGQIDRV